MEEGEDPDADLYDDDDSDDKEYMPNTFNEKAAAKTASQIMMDKVENKRIEMIWFGGIGDELSENVFHVTLKLDLLDNDCKSTEKMEVNSGLLSIKRLRNRLGELVKLKCRDRFFYNQEFYMQKPTEQMTSMGLGYTGRYQNKFFNKNRFIGVVGREAFHVFDLVQMDFITADVESGYKVNLEREADRNM